MSRQIWSTCLVCMLVTMLLQGMVTSAYCADQPPAEKNETGEFLHALVGEWVGTFEETVDGAKAAQKYFHSVTKQSGPNTYESTFDYYLIDTQTHGPVKIGTTTMTQQIAPDGTATSTINGKGVIQVDLETSRNEEHFFSEVLRGTPATGLLGKGTGRISVANMPLGLGKTGRTKDYQSAWSLNNEVLTINQRMKVTFTILLFHKSYNIVTSFEAKRGNDVVGLMKKVTGSTALIKGVSTH